MDYVQGRLRKVADIRNIKDILARERDFKKELRRSECVVLIGSHQGHTRRIRRKRRTCQEQTHHRSLQGENRE